MVLDVFMCVVLLVACMQRKGMWGLHVCCRLKESIDAFGGPMHTVNTYSVNCTMFSFPLFRSVIMFHAYSATVLFLPIVQAHFTTTTSTTTTKPCHSI